MPAPLSGRPAGVYPRVCGGTQSAPSMRVSQGGLSPRVRGNRGWSRKTAPRARSIPACAGEPHSASGRKKRGRVYPRVCGGTLGGGDLQIVRQGLSPRVRGNPLVAKSGLQNPGSIPACAGEPPSRRLANENQTVYPRVCGGTRAWAQPSRQSSGLSPRVRGNHWRLVRSGNRGRSIPACAGEPCAISGVGLVWWVYPRVCGGTRASWRRASRNAGLSPRVRGNRSPIPRVQAQRGSIPACAGEPPRRRPDILQSAVYPRVCGGTLPYTEQRTG